MSTLWPRFRATTPTLHFTSAPHCRIIYSVELINAFETVEEIKVQVTFPHNRRFVFFQSQKNLCHQLQRLDLKKYHRSQILTHTKASQLLSASIKNQQANFDQRATQLPGKSAGGASICLTAVRVIFECVDGDRVAAGQFGI